jgi:uncharacterized protein (TIGR03083 family)
MDVEGLIAAIREQGVLMADAAERSGPDAPVPTCPDWRVRDLVCHQGEVHRWAAAIVRDAMPKPDVPQPSQPDDNDLVPWFRDGCAALVDVLEEADPALECFAFLPAPSPRAFWARRQAHETGIHRVDAERAAGSVTPFSPDLAVDGIEEMLYGFASRSRSRLRSPEPRTLGLRTTDTSGSWIVHIGPDSVTVTTDGGDADADCTVDAAASDLYMLLWNRADRTSASIAGDTSVLDLWQEKMQISWA